MPNGIEKTNNEIAAADTEQTYNSVRGYVIEAQQQVYRAVNFAMVEAYWKIGKEIYEACGESERAAYGKQLLAELSDRLTTEFGKGFDQSNLRYMRRFYLTFPIRDALRPELSWTHYREHKSDTLVEYTLPEGYKQVFASKYLPYMPTEEELKRELKLQDFEKLDAPDDNVSSDA